MAQNLTRTYGPFYGGMLDAQQTGFQQELDRQKLFQSHMGMLAEQAWRQQQGELVRQQIEMAKLNAAREAEKQKRQNYFFDMMQQRMGGAGAPAGALPTDMPDAGPTLVQPQGGGGATPSDWLLDPIFHAAAQGAGINLGSAANVAIKNRQYGLDERRLAAEYGRMKPGEIAANDLALARAAHEGVGLPRPSAPPANDVLTRLESELAGTQHRLAQARQAGDLNGVQRETQNVQVLTNEIQKHQAPSLVRNALGLSPKGAQEIAKAEAEQDIRTRGAYTEAAAKGAYTRDEQQYNAANDAVENVVKLDTIINHLKTSSAITGIGAELLKDIERAKAFVAESKASGKIVSDTELLDAFLGSDVFPMIKALGIGARGLDTPAEREFLRQVMSGTITMNKNTLIRLTEFRRAIAQRAIDRFNDRVRKGEMDRFFTSSGINKSLVGENLNNRRPLTAAERAELRRLREWNEKRTRR